MTLKTYPNKTCTIDRLIRHPKLVQAALEGRKTQQRRDGIYAYPGEVFTLENMPFEVTSVERQKIGEITEADALAEGYPNLAAYKEIILKMHADMIWKDENLVWVHNFRRYFPE